MDNPYIIYGFLAVVAILLIVALIYSARTWRVWHIVAIALTCVSYVVLMAIAAPVLKTHVAWKQKIAQLQADLERQIRENEALRAGDPAKPVASQGENLRSVRAELARLVTGRGRVWRGAVLTAFDAPTGAVTLQTSAPPAEGAPAPPPHGLEVNQMVYLFKETVQEGATPAVPLPVAYGGEFKVATADATSVVLSPTQPLDEAQQAALAAGSNDGSTWALHEVMPIDNYEVFAGLSAEQLRQQMPGVSDAIIEQYVRTGTKWQEGDPLDAKWARVKFNKPITVDVDVAAEQVAAPSTEQFIYFDEEGRARLVNLRRGGAGPADPVKFEAGDIGLFLTQEGDVPVPDKTALEGKNLLQQWIANQDVEVQEYVYMRPLNDYAQIMYRGSLERSDLAERAALATRELASINASIARTEAQIAQRTMEKQKLESDKVNFQAELQVVESHLASMTARREELLAQLRAVYAANLQLAEDLEQLQERVSADVANR
jgi:hypothetical protein